jgi:hypothetical protein
VTQRDAVDAAVFVALGTFIATYALLLFSSQNPGQRLRWYGSRDPAGGQDPVFTTLTLLGTFSVIWGGTGLLHHTHAWLAVLLAVGPVIVLRAVILLAHHRRLVRTSEVTRRP